MHHDLVGQFPGGDALLRGRLDDFDAVLVGAGEEMDLVALGSVPAGQHVGASKAAAFVDGAGELGERGTQTAEAWGLAEVTHAAAVEFGIRDYAILARAATNDILLT
jgi:hypothetical protein